MVSLERRFVKQRNPLLSMPKELRDAAILQTLLPSVVTPHMMIPEYIKEGLKKMAEATLSDKILFSHQIRIMSSQLNPKMRYAPAIPQSDDITGPIRHAICQGNWTLTGYLLPQVEKSTETQKTVQALCISLCQCIKGRRGNERRIIDQFKTAGVGGVPIIDTLKNENIGSTSAISYARASCKIPIIVETVSFGCTFSPEPTKVKEVFARNPDNVRFKKYLGREKVNFKMGAMRGQFTHDSDLIADITTNLTTHSALKELIGAIGVYCRCQMEDINAKSLGDLYRATYERHRVKAHELVLMDVKELHSLSGEKWEGRILRIIPESEYQPRAPIIASVSSDLEVIDPSTNQTFVVEVPDEKVMIGPLVTIGEGPLDGWLDPRRRIIRAFKRILESPQEIVSAIKENNWGLYNESVTELN